MARADLPALVAQLAEALGETASAPRAQIARIVRRCGAARAQAWLAQTQQIEGAGGELLADGSRRRTPGGVFFRLVRTSVTNADRAALFRPFPQATPSHVPPALAPAAPSLPTTTWDDCAVLVAEATAGKATTVKITVLGRPGKVIARPGFVLVLLKKSGPLPSLPKGIPTPAPVPDTDYIVYIGEKQWRTVQAALANEDDVLIVEGTPILDPRFAAITVFATKTTTKQLQQAQRTPSAPSGSEGGERGADAPDRDGVRASS